MDPAAIAGALKAGAWAAVVLAVLAAGWWLLRQLRRQGQLEATVDLAKGEAKMSADEIVKLKQLAAEVARIRAESATLRDRVAAPGVFGAPGDDAPERPNPVRGGAGEGGDSREAADR